MSARIEYDKRLNKYSYNEYPKKVKSDELDKLKEFEWIIENYNKHSDYFYKLKLLKAVKRAWF